LDYTPFPNNSLKFLIGEGLCNDGEHFFIGSKDQIHMVTADSDLNMLMSNYDAIPHYLRAKGYNHLGDCQYADGRIYFPVEEPTYTNPAIFVYKVTEFSIDFLTWSSTTAQSHMPWLAQNPRGSNGTDDSKWFYSSEYDNVSHLVVYDESLRFLGKLVLVSADTHENDILLMNVQGGAFYDIDGLLYVGVNGGDTVYSINATSGETAVVFIQETPGSVDEYEFEGLTFLDLRTRGLGIMHNTGNHEQPARLHHAERKTIE
jgi:hypothetical protein